jgi:hypothetical protein
MASTRPARATLSDCTALETCCVVFRFEIWRRDMPSGIVARMVRKTTMNIASEPRCPDRE